MPLTAKDQIRLGAAGTVYSGLELTLTPCPVNWRIKQRFAKATTTAQENLGVELPMLEGTIILADASVITFIADLVADTTTREIHYWDAGAEYFIYAKGGDVLDRAPLSKGGPAAAKQRVHFQIEGTDTRVFRQSDSAVMWGA